MQESWLENELSGENNEQFMKSATLVIDAGDEEDLKKLPPPPPPPMSIKKKLTVVEPVMVEEEIIVEDDLDIDRVNRPLSNADTTSPPVELRSTQNRPPVVRVSSERHVPVPEKKSPDNPNTVMRKKILKFNLIAVVLGALSSLLILYFVYRAYRSFDKQYFPFESIKESWSKPIIWDLTESVAGSNECPSNYTVSLNYKWPGAFEGCDCTSNTGNYPKSINEVQCTDDMKARGCVVSGMAPGVPLDKWKDTEIFCEQRIAGISMDTMVLNSDPKTRQCKDGFKRCPPAPTDGSVNQTHISWGICVPNAMQRCPLTDLRVAKCSENPDPNCFSTAPEEIVRLNNKNDCLWKSFKCGRGPISRLAVGEGGICRHENDLQIEKDHKEHPLLTKKRVRCVENENTYKIDSVKEAFLLGQHRVQIDEIRGYPQNIEPYNYSLFAVNYHKWQWSHRDEFDIKMVFDNRSLVEKLEGYHSKAIMFFIIGFFVFAVFSPALLYFEWQRPDIYRYNRTLLFGKYLVLWFFKIAAVPVILLIMKYNLDIFRRFKMLGEASFSNQYENERIHALAFSLEKGIYFYDMIALWIAIITIVADIILMIMTCGLEDQKMRTEDLDLDTSLTSGGVEMSKR